MELEDAEEGKRDRVTWDDCCVSGNFEAILERKNYVPDPPEPEPYLESLTFANGITISGHGVGLEEIANVAPSPDPSYEAGYRAGETSLEADILVQFDDRADTMDDLLEFFRTITGDSELQWPGTEAQAP